MDNELNNQENFESNAKAHDYSCPNCSAPIEFDPSKSVLHCDYCGFEMSLTGEKSKEEYDFYEGKVDDSEWNKEVKVVRCQNCGAHNVFDSGEISIKCPFCSSNQVMETEELAGIKPHRVIPFKIDEDKVKNNYKKWLSKKIFVPGKVKKQIPKLKLNGVYLPVWTFDTDTFSNYNGKLGKHYTRTVGSGKNRRTVTEVRYFHIRGTEKVVFDDVVVGAGSKISQQEINAISPFDTNNSFVYDKRYLAGFSSEHYVVRLQKGWDDAKLVMNGRIKSSILSHYHYDVVSYLDVKTSFQNIKYKYVLIPVWICVYTFANKTYRFIANGENGKVSGKSPVSALRVSILIIIIIAIFIALYFFIISE